MPDVPIENDDPEEPDDETAPIANAEASTVGVGSAVAMGCSLIVLLIMLGGVCFFIAQRMTN